MLSWLTTAVETWQSNSGAWTWFAFFMYELFFNSVVPTTIHETRLHKYFRNVEKRQEENNKSLLALMQVVTAMAAVLPQLDEEEIRAYVKENGVDALHQFVDDDASEILTANDIDEDALRKEFG
jgi:hypothetical protein